MKKNLSLISVLLAALIATSCAHNSKVEQKVESEISAVPAQKTESLSQTIKAQINSSNLSSEQKEKLLGLVEKTHAKQVALTDEIERTKVVMVQTVLAPKMNKREFKILKNKIKSLDKERLELGFTTIAEVRKIIAPNASTQDREIYKAVIENRLRGF